MIEWSKYNLDQALEWFSVANTASFLFGKLRTDPSIQALGQSAPIENLKSELAAIAKKENRSLDDVVRAYACIVAITIVDIERTREVLSDADLVNFRWGPAIVELAVGRYVATAITKLTVPSGSESAFAVRSSASETTIKVSDSSK